MGRTRQIRRHRRAHPARSGARPAAAEDRDHRVRIRPWIYDAAVVRMTAAWYHAVLERLPARCRLLDVGIGTGGALLANADLLTRKNLQVTGIDVDVAYVAHCRRAVARRGLGDRVVVRLESVYEHRGGPYDAAYFSGSFMVLPDPVAALRHVSTLLAPGAPVFFTQTIERRRSRTLEVLKPLLRLVTTIDFGQVTYEVSFRRTIAAGGIELEARETLRQGRRRSAMLAVGRRPRSDERPTE
jgi:SAM-dependent methyltransferase